MTTVRQLLDQKGRKIWSIHPNATVFDAIAKMAEKDISNAEEDAVVVFLKTLTDGYEPPAP